MGLLAGLSYSSPTKPPAARAMISASAASPDFLSSSAARSSSEGSRGAGGLMAVASGFDSTVSETASSELIGGEGSPPQFTLRHATEVERMSILKLAEFIG